MARPTLGDELFSEKSTTFFNGSAERGHASNATSAALALQTLLKMTFLRRSVFVGIAVVISLLLLYTGSRALLPSPSLSLATDHVREFSRLNFQNSRDGLRDIQNETLGVSGLDIRENVNS